MRKIADGLIRLSAALGALGLIFEVGVILVDVIGRALGHPLYGSDEYESMAMVILVFGGMAYCDRIGGHIAVDLFERHYPRWFNRLTDLVAALMGAIIFFGLAWATWAAVSLNWRFGLSTQSNLVHLPIDWFQLALVGFAVVTGLAMLLRAVEIAFRDRDVRIEPESHR